jgi:hypothetical protein
MTPISTAPATVRALKVPGARLHYEVRGEGPLVVLVGAPMDARAFAPLADLLAVDHTVLTTDPRGINRSPVDDPDQDSNPAAARRRPLPAPEPPRRRPGRGPGLQRRRRHRARSRTDPLRAGAHRRRPRASGGGAARGPRADPRPDRGHHRRLPLRRRDGGWAKFFAQANIALPEDACEAMFGGERDPQQVADERRWFEHELRATVRWQPDLAALRSASTRIVVGIGDDSAGQVCDRTSKALAAALGIEPAMFFGGHTGFAEDPDRFATQLRTVLRAN